MATTMKVQKGDLVQILSGKDRGKQGRVIEARPAERRVIVENLNIVKRHTKPRPMRDANRMGGTTMMPGGVIDKPAPLAVSKVMVVCPSCNLPTRVGHVFKEIKGKKVKVRVCRRARLRRGARQVSSASRERENGYAPRLKELYEQELRPQLKDELGLSSVMQVPRVTKITLNMGVGDAKTEAKALDGAMDELSTIAGQRAQMRRARKSIAAFKLREGMPIGARVTLRGARMYEFLDRLVSIALPRIRDFRGLDPGSFDGRGNYSLGIREQIIFPEINYDDVAAVRGLDIAITTSAADDEGARALLRGLGLPFADDRRDRSNGQEVDDRQGRPPAALQGARVLALQPVRAPARGLQEVRALPHLPAGARPRGRDPRA